MIRIQGPRAYVQGPGILKKLGSLVQPLGSHFLVVTGHTGMTRYRAAVEEGFREAGAAVEFVRFGGESTAAEADRVTALAREAGCDGVIGLGGHRVSGG